MKNFNIIFDERETTQTHMKCHLMANISNNNRNPPSQLKKISFTTAFNGAMPPKDIQKLKFYNMLQHITLTDARIVPKHLVF